MNRWTLTDYVAHWTRVGVFRLPTTSFLLFLFPPLIPRDISALVREEKSGAQHNQIIE